MVSSLTPTTRGRPSASSQEKRTRFFVYVVAASVLLSLTALILFAVARAGLVDVPFFSRFYQPPAPTRVVPVVEPISTEQFRALVALRLRENIKIHPRPPYDLFLTEQELSAALQGSVGQALNGPNVRPERVQVVILDDVLEFSGRFNVGWLRLDTIARVKPVVDGTVIRFETKEIKIGQLPLPASWAQKLLGLALARDIGTWELSASGIAVRSVSLQPGRLTIEIDLPQP